MTTMLNNVLKSHKQTDNQKIERMVKHLVGNFQYKEICKIRN